MPEDTIDLASLSYELFGQNSFAWNDAAVYADQSYLQVLEWSYPGGLSGLAESSRFIRTFPINSMQSSPHLSEREPEKCVLFLSTHLSRWVGDIFQIIHSFPYSQLFIFTPLSESIHVTELSYDESLEGVWSTPEDPADTDDGYFAVIQHRLRSWIASSHRQHGRKLIANNVAATIRVLPIPHALLLRHAFIIPSAQSLFPEPSLHSNERPLSSTGLAQLSPDTKKEDNRLTLDRELRHLGATISSLLDVFHHKDEIYALGPTSEGLARIIISQSSDSSRRRADKCLSLILIDRTLDVVGCSMQPDSLPDLLAEYVSDFKANCAVEASSLHGVGVSMGHAFSNGRLDYLDLFSSVSIQEGLIHLRRELSSALSSDLGTVESKSSPFNLLETSVRNLLNDVNLAKLDLAEFVAVFVEALRAADTTGRDQLLGIEKVLNASLAETGESKYLIQQLRETLKQIALSKQSKDNEMQVPYATRDILLLCLFLFSLIGDTLPVPDTYLLILKDAFVKAMTAGNPTANLKAVQAWVAKMFTQIQYIKSARQHLHHFKQLLVPYGGPIPYDPLVGQVADYLGDLANRSAQGIQSSENTLEEKHDLKHIPYNRTLDSVVSGFSRLLGRSTSKHDPSQADVILIFVVGGVTFKEISLVKQRLSQSIVGSRSVVFVGGTNIATRATMMKSIFKAK